MKHREISQFVLTGMALVILSTSGCSSMKWFQSGSDELSDSNGKRGKGSQIVQGDKEGQSTRSAKEAREQGGQDGQFPAIGRQEGMSDPEGGSLQGFTPLVNGRIAGEERLSRSDYSRMMIPVERNEKHLAELRREEAAAIEAGLQDVFYGYDRWSISEEGAAVLVKNADWLKANTRAQLKISGHCDERGTHDYNLVLGEKRAKAAKGYLVDLGVSPKQVAIVSYGKERPFCGQHDEACYQQNRRGHMMLRK
jgi:peptidoglycan-associated lipoprotein